MLKKKPKSNPKETDFSSLDSAVNELSKQTAELLGSFDTKPEKAGKPTLPKKHAAVHAKTKSFDIIHDPKQKTRLRSTLKALPKVDTPLLEEGDVVSKNPTPASSAVIEGSPAAIVHTHKEGVLHGGIAAAANSIEETPESGASSSLPTKPAAHNALSFDDSEKKADDTKGDTKESSASPKISTKKLEESETTSEFNEPIKNEPENASSTESKSDGESLADTATADISKEPTGSKNSEVVSGVSAKSSEFQADTKNEEQLVKEESSSYRGELYANNLVKEVEPKGYEGSGTDKPVVFDTDEYHPELHDWSKLQHKTGSSLIILLLILVIAGVLAYAVLSGQKLPFIQ